MNGRKIRTCIGAKKELTVSEQATAEDTGRNDFSSEARITVTAHHPLSSHFARQSLPDRQF
jgi:hypothetical protein